MIGVIHQPLAYPIDGYITTGIRRLSLLELAQKGELKGTPLPKGAQKSIKDIQLNLLHTTHGNLLKDFPIVDPKLQKEVNRLFPNLDESYSVAILDISPDKPMRYAQRQATRGFQPGSVGKLAIITALFCELENQFPDSFEKRQELLKNKMVRAGSWAIYDEHTVPFFDVITKKLVKRQVQEKDVFSLYEWADHTLSVSNNGAASVVWREVILMREFGKDYPTLTEEQGEHYFKSTQKSVLSDMAISVVNEPLRGLGIGEDEWRLGTMFTRGATSYIPGKGGSLGTPIGLMKWMIALENGQITDAKSSLEIKRLMYMTDRRIRYAANTRLKDAAVYFKSGSLYKCDRTTMPNCGKYMGNVQNFMNSVAIVEHGDSTRYMVALMSNVLRKNSNLDHNGLAGKIDGLMR